MSAMPAVKQTLRLRRDLILRVRPLKPAGGGLVNLCRLWAPDRWPCDNARFSQPLCRHGEMTFSQLKEISRLVGGHCRRRFTSSGARRNSKRCYKDLDWQGVVDHIAAEIWIMSVWLATLVCSHRTCQQRIT